MERDRDPDARGYAVRAGLARLRAASADGTLARICDEFDVGLLTLHGSAAHDDDRPQDLDLGVRFTSADAAQQHLVPLIVAIVELVGTDLVDIMDVRRASPTARARALAHDSQVLYEASPGLATQQQMAAQTLEMEMAPLRRRQLELLATI